MTYNGFLGTLNLAQSIQKPAPEIGPIGINLTSNVVDCLRLKSCIGMKNWPRNLASNLCLWRRFLERASGT